ncbi:hypothetical protein [Demequina gelatinilytica]|uniref:hypothetical protein n=1 Tax=Demequina gelatinilytica TaxID=1638980 RepID=UPI0007845CC7|nr:hypothetical protein [Demequina gelatinilytica]
MAVITIKNAGPFARDVPLLRCRVGRGETVEVSEDHARILLAQDSWKAVSKAAKDIQVELDEPTPIDDADEAPNDDADEAPNDDADEAPNDDADEAPNDDAAASDEKE